MPFSEEMKHRVASALATKGVRMPCPRCGTNAWTLVDGFLVHPLTDDVNQIIIGGRSLPTVALVCNHCGYVTEYAAVLLGVLEPFPDPDEVQDQASPHAGSAPDNPASQQ
jgi:hypothetical protein